MSERPVHGYIKVLSEALVQLSDKVLGHFYDTLEAVRLQDLQRARQLRQADDEIDVAEVKLEERCLAFLALHQPVARDLRTIITIIKINDDLERIADLAVHIIDRMPHLAADVMDRYAFDKMGRLAGEMVRQSIEAFIGRDRELAERVCKVDEDVDAMHRMIFKKVAEEMKEAGSNTEQLLAVLSVSRYIERMADHATRISQEVIYLVTGEIVRHTEEPFEKMIR